MVENNSQSDSRVIKYKTQSDSELTSQGHGTQGQGQGEILDISLTCPAKYKLGDDRIPCNENDSNKDESITPVRGQGQIIKPLQSGKAGNDGNFSQSSISDEENLVYSFPFAEDFEFGKNDLSQDRPPDTLQSVNATCYYVSGKIGSIRGKFLIDTGSSICVISEKVFNRLSGENINLLPSNRQVRTADGTFLKVKGSCTLQIQLDHLLFDQEFIVANIEESLGILGINFIDQYEVDIKIRKKVLKTNNGKIKLHKQNFEGCCRIQLCDKVTLPPQSETFVKTYTAQNCAAHLNIVEPTNKYIDQGLLISKTLVDTSQTQMTVSVLNVSNKSVTLKPNLTLGIIHPIEKISICDPLEDGKAEHKTPEAPLPEHLQPLVDNVSSELTGEEKQKLSSVVGEFQDVFTSPDGKLGQTNLAEHYIETGDTKPFKMPCRRIPLFKRHIVESEIKKMLDQGVIEPSTSPWNSPICLVAKKSGEWRFCIDLRALNSVTRLDSFPLPRIDDTLDRLSNSQFYSTLDMACGYWQLSLSEKDREKTSFAVPGIGTFMFKVMCFGLKNAPASFSRLMEVVLRQLQFDKCLVYLDDIIVLGKDFDTALENLRAVFLRLRQANLKLKVSKCQLLQKQVVFLGHLVSDLGITCAPDKVQQIEDWPQPRDKTEVKSFLGLVGYYRKMVPSFAEIAVPLTRLTRKKAKFEWGSEHETAFFKLKERLIQPPILAFPLETGGKFVLDTDASGVAIGAVLSQYQNNEERVIAYGSHTLNPAQQNYCATKRELYSVVYFVQHFKQYLLGRSFILRTDHKPLIWLSNFKEPSGILARWISILGSFDFDTVFRAGYLHSNADSMSRKPIKKLCPFPECSDCSQGETSSTSGSIPSPSTCQQVPCDDTSNALHSTDGPDIIPNWLNVWTNEELQQLQQQDVCISEILRLKEQFDTKPSKSEIQQVHKDIITLWHQWELLKVVDHLLYKQIDDDMGVQRLQLLTPREIRDIIFIHLHEQRYAGHLGRDRTIAAIKKRFYWPGMGEDVARWCQECQLCARRKPGPGKGKSTLQQFKVFQPMSVFAVDILGPLPRTNNSNEYIIVCGCYFTKWKEAFAVPNHTAATVADKLVQEVFLRFGFPTQLHSDQGREFESDLFQAMCSLLGIEKTRTVSYNPKSDGLIERFNRTLAAMLAMFVDANQKDWDDHLPYVMAAYRATQHKSTGVSPNLLMLNRELNYPLDLMVGPPPNQNMEQCPIKYIQWVQQAMLNAFTFTHGQLGLAAKRQKRGYERGLKPREYKEGSWVWRWYPPAASQKLGLGWIGPYLVIKQVSFLTYRIQKDRDSNPLVVHVDQLKPFQGRRHPDNWLRDSEREPELPGPQPIQQETPMPVRSRRGRVIRPRQIYSPE